MTDRRALSRRKLLWAVATTGAAASTGGGAVAVMHDRDIVSSSVAAGMLDLDTEPSWGNDSGSGSFGTASEGDSGTETVTLSVSDNPSYIWFGPKCPQCTPVEEALFVRFGVDTDGDGTVDRWLSDDFLSLRTARDQFGEGANLGEIDPTETWQFVVEWELRESVRDDTNVGFDFSFHATQSRHVMNTDAVAPDWECDGCTGTDNGSESSLPTISWVAFCSSQQLSKDDFEFSRSDDERTLVFDTLPDAVDTILLKYGSNLDVFENAPQTVTAGSGTTHTQRGNSYPGTEPMRSNSTPCPGSYGCKYEFPDGTGPGGWECTVPDRSTSGGSPQDRNGEPPGRRGPPQSMHSDGFVGGGR